MPQFLDAGTVRQWARLALDRLGAAREEIDAINVYPVADGDTGTNLYLTMESALHEVEECFAAVRAGEAVVGAAAGREGGADDPAADAHRPSSERVLRAMAHGALVGARGNSGTILAQLMRGAARSLSQQQLPPTDAAGAPQSSTPAPASRPVDGRALAQALEDAAAAARSAVAHPVEGTVLTVASAAAEAARAACGQGDPRGSGSSGGTGGTGGTGGWDEQGGAAPAPTPGSVALAAYEGARIALDATPDRLEVLARAGVVDAGGCGLVAVLAALVEALTGRRPEGQQPSRTVRGPAVHTTERPGGGRRAGHGEDGADAHGADRPGATAPGCRPEAGEPAPRDAAEGASPAFEVIYLLEADDEAVRRLREALDVLGDSLVVVGGDGLWNVHVHVDDAGAAVEAGIEAGRPYRIRITHFGAEDAHSRPGARPAPRVPRAVVAVVPGAGLGALYEESGAVTVATRPDRAVGSAELADAVRRANADEVVLLPNDAGLRHTAAAVAEQLRSEGLRLALIPTRSPVQGLAALAVHEPERRFDEDVVQMTSAAGATRYGELVVAERESWTSAGICQAGDVLGLIDSDVAVIGPDPAGTARTVVDRMLSGGGELVTLVLGEDFPEDAAEELAAHVRRTHLAVDAVVYRGGHEALLLVGVE